MVQRCFMFTKFGLLVISSALGGRSEKFIASFADHAQSREPSYESKSTVKPFAVLQDTASKKPTPILYRLTWLVVRHTNSIRHIRHWGKSSQIWLHKILKPPVPHDGIMLRMGQDRIYYARWYDVLHWLVVQ